MRWVAAGGAGGDPFAGVSTSSRTPTSRPSSDVSTRAIASRLPLLCIRLANVSASGANRMTAWPSTMPSSLAIASTPASAAPSRSSCAISNGHSLATSPSASGSTDDSAAGGAGLRRGGRRLLLPHHFRQRRAFPHLAGAGQVVIVVEIDRRRHDRRLVPRIHGLNRRLLNHRRVGRNRRGERRSRRRGGRGSNGDGRRRGCRLLRRRRNLLTYPVPFSGLFFLRAAGRAVDAGEQLADRRELLRQRQPDQRRVHQRPAALALPHVSAELFQDRDVLRQHHRVEPLGLLLEGGRAQPRNLHQPAVRPARPQN